MDVSLLIDAIVRQTTVLIAQLATAAGGRATLARTANQVFLSLTQELKQQGLGSKVIADMFGLALRTYQNRVQRLSESGTFAGRSLWEAVLDHVRDAGPVTRAEVLTRFVRDEPASVRAVLSDLVGTQLLVKTGRGDTTAYRVATNADRVLESPEDAIERAANLLWVAIHRFGPIDVRKLAEIVPASDDVLEQALERLSGDGRVRSSDDHPTQFICDNYLIPIGSQAGWEGAVFDHYQAMVTALCIKLRAQPLRSEAAEWVGGSTYCYDVWEGHPEHDAVAGFLSRMRAEAVHLRERVEAANAVTERPPGAIERRFTTYVGQSVISEELQGENE
jgi:hypothetical protein